MSSRLDTGMKFDVGKLQYSLVDADAEAEMVAVLTYGAVKYDPGNWVHVPNAEDRYYDALRRHLRDARRGVSIDSETNLHALAHAACDIHFLLGLELRKNPELIQTFPERFQYALQEARRLRTTREAKKI